MYISLYRFKPLLKFLESKKNEGAFFFTTTNSNLDVYCAISFAYKLNGMYEVDQSMSLEESIAKGGSAIHSVDMFIQAMHKILRSKSDISDFTFQDSTGTIFINIGELHMQLATKDFIEILFTHLVNADEADVPFIVDTLQKNLQFLTGTNSGIRIVHQLWKKYAPKDAQPPDFLLKIKERLPIRTFKSEARRQWRAFKQ